MAKKRKHPAAVALGRRGGKARLTTMTAEQRSAIARLGGLAGGVGRPKVPLTQAKRQANIEPWKPNPTKSNAAVTAGS